MKKLFALFAVVFLLLAGASFAQKKKKDSVVVPTIKKITHFLSFDLDKNDFTVYDSTDDVKVYVVGPEGVTPAVVIGETSDKKAVLLGSVSIATRALHKGAPDDPLNQQPPASAPTPESGSAPLHTAEK